MRAGAMFPLGNICKVNTVAKNYRSLASGTGVCQRRERSGRADGGHLRLRGANRPGMFGIRGDRTAYGVRRRFFWLFRRELGFPQAPLREGLARLSAGWATAWLIFRIVGAAVTVPLAEQLAFRGYLLRRLQSADWRELPPAPGCRCWFPRSCSV